MQVDSNAFPAKWADLPLGSFFGVLKNELEWHIRVATDDKPDASICFKNALNRGGNPWLSIGVVENDPLLYFPEALIRLDYKKAISISKMDFHIGAIHSSGKQHIIQVAVEVGNTFYFDIVTGKQVKFAHTSDAILYNSWSCGMMQDEKYEEYFAFPIK